jgi:hypothetical protein
MNSLPRDVAEGDHSNAGSSVNERYLGKVTASWNSSTGKPSVYNLTIHNVNINDSGLYNCVEDMKLGTEHYNLLTVCTTGILTSLTVYKFLIYFVHYRTT